MGAEDARIVEAQQQLELDFIGNHTSDTGTATSSRVTPTVTFVAQKLTFSANETDNGADAVTISTPEAEEGGSVQTNVTLSSTAVDYLLNTLASGNPLASLVIAVVNQNRSIENGELLI